MIGSASKGILLAILAAALYAINTPLSKLLLPYASPTLMAGLLYLGAGLGMDIIAMGRRLHDQKQSESGLPKKNCSIHLFHRPWIYGNRCMAFCLWQAPLGQKTAKQLTSCRFRS